MGASRGGAEPAGPFIFVWLMGEGSVNHEDPGLPSPFPGCPRPSRAALALPGQPSTWAPFLLWAPLETPLPSPLSHPTPAPGLRPHLRKNLISRRPQGPNLGQRACHPGPVREPDAPGPGSAEPAKPQASLVLLCPPAVRAARPGPGRTCICRSTDFFWPRGLRRGFGSRAQRKQGLWRRRAVRGYQSWSGERRGDE